MTGAATLCRRVWEAQRREAENRLASIGLYPYKVTRMDRRAECHSEPRTFAFGFKTPSLQPFSAFHPELRLPCMLGSVPLSLHTGSPSFHQLRPCLSFIYGSVLPLFTALSFLY